LEVGSLTPVDAKNHDIYDPNLGEVLIRVPELCICGVRSEVENTLIKIEMCFEELTECSSFYESEIFYNSLKEMDKEDVEMLNIRLCIE
jgi:hypothetical protein